jgi:hypothetical protein
MSIENFNVWAWIRENTLKIIAEIDISLKEEEEKHKPSKELIEYRGKIQEEVDSQEKMDAHYALDLFTLQYLFEEDDWYIILNIEKKMKTNEEIEEVNRQNYRLYCDSEEKKD